MIRALALLLLTVPAYAQDATLRYATFADLPTALSLSAQAWQAMECQPRPACDPANVTTYNYPVIGLTNNQFAIVIHTGDVYQGEHLSIPSGRSYNLTAQQIASLATRAQMNTLLGDVLPVALVNSRVTAPQLAAINTYANAHPAFKTEFTTLTSGPVDLEGTLIWAVMSELQAAGILTAADVATITAPQAVAQVTQ